MRIVIYGILCIQDKFKKRNFESAPHETYITLQCLTEADKKVTAETIYRLSVNNHFLLENLVLCHLFFFLGKKKKNSLLFQFRKCSSWMNRMRILYIDRHLDLCKNLNY